MLKISLVLNSPNEEGAKLRFCSLSAQGSLYDSLPPARLVQMLINQVKSEDQHVLTVSFSVAPRRASGGQQMPNMFCGGNANELMGLPVLMGEKIAWWFKGRVLRLLQPGLTCLFAFYKFFNFWASVFQSVK